jgi:hypothetical protein
MEDAANAMEKVPDAINKVVTSLGSEGKGDIVEKALTNSDKLTKDELSTFKEAVGAGEDGKVDSEN